jgi:hypothetical protein
MTPIFLLLHISSSWAEIRLHTEDQLGIPDADPVMVESDTVTSTEGRRRLILIGNDVVGLFPALKEQRTGRIAGEMVEKSEMVVEGADYTEMARYCAGNRHLCSSLKEVERLLPWRVKKRGGRVAGMQNPEMKGKKSGMRKVWKFPKATPTEREKRILRARVVEIGVRTVFRNFVYEFGGEDFLQREGGPIGARVTMAVSRLVMQHWAENYRAILERSGLEVRLLKGFVDDGRQGTDLMIRGTGYDEKRKRFVWRKEWEDEDDRIDAPDEVRMAKICNVAMNDINPDLVFTTETRYDFQNGRLATLDFEVDVI